MINVQIVPASTEHIAPLLENVRQADVDEFYAASLESPEEVIETGIRISTQSWAGIINGQVVAVFGVSPCSMLNGKGIPWLVGSTLLEKYQYAFLRRCRPVLSVMLDMYPHLENYVDERNDVAKSWLLWLGFKIDNAEPVGPLGYPFHRFTMEKK